jgi:hypothetical protein
MMLSNDEKIRVEAFDYLRQEIIRDILLEDDPSWFNEPQYKSKPAYERGVRAVLRLITHRIDCIID